MNVSRVAWRRIRIDEDAVRRLVEEGRAVLRPADPVPIDLPPPGFAGQRVAIARVRSRGLRCPWGRRGDLVAVGEGDVWARIEDVGVEWDAVAVWWLVILVRVESPVTFRPLRVIPRRSA